MCTHRCQELVPALLSQAVLLCQGLVLQDIIIKLDNHTRWQLSNGTHRAASLVETLH
jgi:hypothetical protein